MKERKLKIIIISIGIAVVVLIAVQLYWIDTAISVQRERFRRDVHRALNVVVDKLDKSETAEVVVRKLKDEDNDLLFWSEKEEEKIIGDSARRFLVRSKHMKNKKTGDKFDFNFSDSGGKGKKIFSAVVVDGDGNKTVVETTIDSLVERKKKFVNDVLAEIMVENNDGDEFINGDKVDSLLSAELGDNGIHTSYSFKIIGDSDNFVYFVGDENQDLEEKEEDVFRVRLSPRNVLNKPKYISLAFPDEDSFIIESVTGMLVLSAAVIILIIFLFYKTVRMLINQKRITEIKNDLINNITHEFKTPISTIALAAEALKEPQLTPDLKRAGKYSDMIVKENKRLGELVENLLNTAALQKGNYNFKISQFDVHKLLIRLEDKFKSDSNGTKVRFVRKFNAENPMISADEFHISNSFENLIDNAVKYSPGDAEIILQTENKNNNIEISFVDNGPGIEKQHQKKVFETFYRIPTGNIHDVKGNGIGLSYVKKIIEAHGGTIELFSGKGNGSEFRITLQSAINEK